MDNYEYGDSVSGHEVLSKWFSSDVWENICETDDESCVELMERVSDHLGSLIFHVQNKSGEERIQYELRFFTDLCQQFDVELF